MSKYENHNSLTVIYEIKIDVKLKITEHYFDDSNISKNVLNLHV